MASQNYYRSWYVYLRGEKIGEVLAATQTRTAPQRAVRMAWLARVNSQPEVTGDAPISRVARDFMKALPVADWAADDCVYSYGRLIRF
jgi:hypothetical protein